MQLFFAAPNCFQQSLFWPRRIRSPVRKMQSSFSFVYLPFFFFRGFRLRLRFTPPSPSSVPAFAHAHSAATFGCSGTSGFHALSFFQPLSPVLSLSGLTDNLLCSYETDCRVKHGNDIRTKPFTFLQILFQNSNSFFHILPEDFLHFLELVFFVQIVEGFSV